MAASNLERIIQWDFLGGAVGLVLVVLGAIVLVALSYRFTLRALPTKRKVLLAVIRIASLAIIILCLCDPRVVTVRKISRGGKKRVAVVVDASSSMRKKTFSGSTRLKDAVAYWKKRAAEIAPEVDRELYVFDETLRKTRSFDTLGTGWKPIRKTHLYSAVEDVCAKYRNKRFDGAIFITDGVDTSDAAYDVAALMLKSSMLPCVFVPAVAPVPHKPFARFARIECASVAKENSSVPGAMLVAYSGLAPGTELSIDIALDGRKKIFHRTIKMDSPAPANKNIPFSLDLKSPGEYEYEATLSAKGNILSKASWTVACVRKHPAKVLLYMGGLDWGARFLRTVAALEKEDFELDVKSAPGILTGKVPKGKVDASFPSEVELERYSIVIVLKMRREQISQEIERRLHDYVSGGGALLFITANSASAANYANSPLEKLLPVFFEKNFRDQSKFDPKTAAFLKKMEAYRKKTKARGMAAWSKYDPKVDYSIKEPPLTTMALTREGEASPIFSYLKMEKKDWKKISLPAFQDFALITEAKPGAEILAVHPEFKSKGKRRILLAVQRYGSGKTAVLATDPLWRWKLSLKSRDPSYELFWKYLIGWLSSGVGNEPTWRLPSMLLETGVPAAISLDIPAAAEFYDVKFQFHVVDLENGSKTPLTPRKSTPRRYQFKFTPPRASRYRLVASVGGKTVATAVFSSSPERDNPEIELLTPNVGVLKRLAAASPSGLLIPMTDGLSRIKWLKTDNNDSKIEIRKATPLWHRAWLFLLLLLLFATDLCVRRFFRLV